MINYIIHFCLGFAVFYLLNFTLYEYLTIELNNDKGNTRTD